VEKIKRAAAAMKRQINPTTHRLEVVTGIINAKNTGVIISGVPLALRLPSPDRAPLQTKNQQTYTPLTPSPVLTDGKENTTPPTNRQLF